MADGALEPYRMLDLTNERGLLCGKIFADLGADVIKIEPPGGDRARNIGPFYRDARDPEKSLFWWAFNTGKKSITLNLETAEARQILKGLVMTADFLVESFDPGYLDELGIGYSVLRDSNQRLIMGSITPFGQSGPHAKWKGPDIVPWATSGYMWMTGEPGRAPLRISCPPQAYLHASATTAAGLLMALRYRHATGKGQHVDTSAQQCPTWMLTHTYAYWDLLKVNLGRAGVLRHFGERFLKTVWQCKDGYITFMFAGGLIGAKGQRQVVRLMDEAGMAEEWLKQFNWEEWSAGTGSQEEVDRISEAFGRYFKTKTKAELLDEAIRHDIMLAPVNTIADMAANPQLKDRDYWVEVAHQELGAVITYPGAPCKLTKTPWQIERRAPLIGEHNTDIYERELGFSKAEIAVMKAARTI